MLQNTGMMGFALLSPSYDYDGYRKAGKADA
jgi:hypothetical protein